MPAAVLKEAVGSSVKENHDDAVLAGRVIDRSIRPLFPKTYKHDVQVSLACHRHSISQSRA